MSSRTLVDLRGRMSRLAQEAKDLHQKDARTADEDTRVDQIILEMNDIGPQIEREVGLESAAARAAGQATIRPSGGLVEHPAVADHSTESGGRRLVRKSLGRQFTESEAYKRAIRSGDPLTNDDPLKTEGFFADRYHRRYAFDHTPDMTAEEMRTLVYSGTLPASMVLPQVLPEVYRAGEAPLVVRDVLINARTTSDQVTFMKETAFTNNAAEVAESTTTGDAAGVKPESALTFSETTVSVKWIAHWIPITRQMLQDAAQMESYVNDRLLTGLRRREDNQLLNGDGTGSNLTGILATSGITLADAAYFAANPVRHPGTDLENMERLRRAIRLVRWTALNNPTFVVINPADAEALDTLLTPQGVYLFGGPLVPPVRNYWGLTAVESANIAAGTSLVGDGAMAAVFDRMDAQLFTTDSHSDYFIRNILVILAEERLALAVFRPAAFVKVTLA